MIEWVKRLRFRKHRTEPQGAREQPIEGKTRDADGKQIAQKAEVAGARADVFAQTVKYPYVEYPSRAVRQRSLRRRR